MEVYGRPWIEVLPKPDERHTHALTLFIFLSMLPLLLLLWLLFIDVVAVVAAAAVAAVRWGRSCATTTSSLLKRR